MTDSLTNAPSVTAVPSSAQLVARIKDLHPLLAGNAAQGEQDRRVVSESIVALTEAGIFKVAQPKRYGGYETSVRTFLDVFSAVVEADSGTAWVMTLRNACAWLVGLFLERAQDDVWADNPDAKVSGVLAPSAETRKVEGGYRVTGRWYYNSGSRHADWAALGIPVTDERGEAVDQGLALLPRKDMEIEETWFVAGMRSSGSNCLIASEVFVPDHRVRSVPPAIEGHYGTEYAEEVLYRMALVPVMSLVLAGPQLGMGRAALQLVRDKATRKPISYTSYSTQCDSVVFQMQLAKAAMLIDTAQPHATVLPTTSTRPPPAASTWTCVPGHEYAPTPIACWKASLKPSTSCCSPTAPGASPRPIRCNASGVIRPSRLATRSRRLPSTTRFTAKRCSAATTTSHR